MIDSELSPVPTATHRDPFQAIPIACVKGLVLFVHVIPSGLVAIDTVELLPTAIQSEPFQAIPYA